MKEKQGKEKINRKKYPTLPFIEEQPKILRYLGFKPLTVNILCKMGYDHRENDH